MNSESQNPNELPPLLGEPERQDVYQIHQSILEREKQEPREGLEPTPWWVWAVSVCLIFAMGFYLGRYSGAFSPEAHQLSQKAGLVRAQPPAPPQGDLIFSAICAPCHQPDGLGVEGKFPPLAGSEWLTRNPEVPVRIVLRGLVGPIQVAGRSFQREMPPLGGQLSDAEIAAVLTHERSSWGNKAGPVDAGLVTKIRKETAGHGPWTADTLLK